MAGYHRVTRECSLNSMQPALATAVRHYIIGLGPEPAERKFREMLKEAVEAAR